MKWIRDNRDVIGGFLWSVFLLSVAFVGVFWLMEIWRNYVRIQEELSGQMSLMMCGNAIIDPKVFMLNIAVPIMFLSLTLIFIIDFKRKSKEQTFCLTLSFIFSFVITLGLVQSLSAACFELIGEPVFSSIWWWAGITDSGGYSWFM
jgi:hypothetical protein